MDTLTHALSGALLARATAPQDAPPRSIPRRVAAGFFAAAAPDLDIVLGFVSPLVYLEQHRGPTHSILLLPLWALPLSWLLAKILREQRGWQALYGITALCLGAHILGDLITSFSTILLAGLLLSAIWRRSRAPALAASVVLVCYVGFQAVLKERALDFARDYARAQGLQKIEVTAIPRAAWESPALGFMRWFAEKPAFDGLGHGSTCAWFIDLRFVNPGRDWVPFQYGACRETPADPWRAYQRMDAGGRVLLH